MNHAPAGQSIVQPSAICLVFSLSERNTRFCKNLCKLPPITPPVRAGHQQVQSISRNFREFKDWDPSAVSATSHKSFLHCAFCHQWLPRSCLLSADSMITQVMWDLFKTLPTDPGECLLCSSTSACLWSCRPVSCLPANHEPPPPPLPGVSPCSSLLGPIVPRRHIICNNHCIQYLLQLLWNADGVAASHAHCVFSGFSCPHWITSQLSLLLRSAHVMEQQQRVVC